MNTNTKKLIFILVFLLPATCSLVCSKVYWGYYFYPPTINFKKFDIVSYSPILGFRYDTRNKSFRSKVVTKVITLEDEYLYEEEFLNKDYYYPSYRIFANIHSHGIERDNSATTVLDEEVKSIIDLLLRRKFFEYGTDEYPATNDFSGYALRVTTEKNKILYVFSIMSGPVENDHYPLYDIILSYNNGNITSITYENKYYEDVAGIEGVRAPLLFIIFLIPFAILAFLLYLADLD